MSEAGKPTDKPSVNISLVAILFLSVFFGTRMLGLGVTETGAGIAFHAPYSGEPTSTPISPALLQAIVGALAGALPVLWNMLKANQSFAPIINFVENTNTSLKSIKADTVKLKNKLGVEE